MAAELTQVYYKDEHIEHCYPFAKLYKNETLTMFFENSVIEKVVSESQADKISVCSWKLKKKRLWNIGRPRELTQEVLETDYDVLAFTQNTKYHGMLFVAAKVHPGFKEAMVKICRHVGLNLPEEVKTPIYQNAFSAKQEIYKDYVSNYLTPAMKVMISDPELYALVTKDSRYGELNKHEAVPREYLMEKIGFPFYPLSPFILERLFSVYCHCKRIRIMHL